MAEARIKPAAAYTGLTLSQPLLRMMRLLATASLLLATPVAFQVLHAQPPAASTPDVPKYDVASIKPSPADSPGLMLMMTPTGIRLKGAPTQILLQFAFGAEPDHILGAPAWVRSNRYEIEARVKPEDAPKLATLTAEQKRAMMLPLLEERFGLKYHHESRDLPIYALVVAKGGPKLTASKPGEGIAGPGGHTPPLGGVVTRPGAPPPSPGLMARTDGPQGPEKRPVIGEGMRMEPGGIQSRGGNMAFLAHALSGILGRTVVDKSGLTGSYDFSLNWTPDQSMRSPLGGREGGAPEGDAAPDAAGPTLFTAVQEQLGLKLEPQKGAVDVIVIDHIDQPTEN